MYEHTVCLVFTVPIMYIHKGLELNIHRFKLFTYKLVSSTKRSSITLSIKKKSSEWISMEKIDSLSTFNGTISLLKRKKKKKENLH